MPSYNFKRKGGQVRFTPQQTTSLERRFTNHKYLSPEDRKHLAMQLKLSDRQVCHTITAITLQSPKDLLVLFFQVKTWFQNRRAKWRRSNSSVSTSEHQNQHTKNNNNYLLSGNNAGTPLNLDMNSGKSSEKYLNVVATTDDEVSSDEDGELEINLTETQT